MAGAAEVAQERLSLRACARQSVGAPQRGPHERAVALDRQGAEHLDAFKANPDKYLPQYGGFCAFGAALGKKFDGNPRLWKIVNGKLYFNLNEEIVSKWVTDIPGNIAKADQNWKKIAAKRPDQL